MHQNRQNLIEISKLEICDNCPGTCWGQKSICRTHDMHISQVERCREWEKWEENKVQVKMAIDLLTEVEEELKSYHWRIKEISRLERYLDKIISSSPSVSKLVSQYGIEAVLPKGKGRKLSSISISEKLFERQVERLKYHQEKVDRIDRAIEAVQVQLDDKQRTILDCLLAGEKIVDIAEHVGMSRVWVHESKRAIIKKLSYALYSSNIKIK